MNAHTDDLPLVPNDAEGAVLTCTEGFSFLGGR